MNGKSVFKGLVENLFFHCFFVFIPVRHTTSLPFTISAHRKSQHTCSIGSSDHGGVGYKNISAVPHDCNEIEFANVQTAWKQISRLLHRSHMSFRLLHITYYIHASTCSWMNGPFGFSQWIILKKKPINIIACPKGGWWSMYNT